MLNQHGQVTEGTSNNIWMVKDGVVKTPPLQSGILEGLTRKTVLEILRRQSIPHQQESFLPAELKAADECFFTSSTREIVPIVQIDGEKIGDGKPGTMSRQLLKLYHQYIQEYCMAALHKKSSSTER
jgi:branched-chain amino acid aminotransferase